MSRNAGIRVTDNDHIKAVAMAVDEAIKTVAQKERYTFFLTILFNHHLFFDTAFAKSSPRDKDPTGLWRWKAKTLLPLREVKNVGEGKANKKRTGYAQRSSSLTRRLVERTS